MKLLYTILTCIVLTITANADTLRKGAFFATSEEDLKTLISLSLENDTEAIARMVLDGRVALPADHPLQIKVVKYSMFDPGFAGFRVRGHIDIYWAVTEDIIPTIPYPTPN